MQELVELGCRAPCKLESLEQFSKLPTNVADGAGVDFGGGDMASRVQFFSSALYKDYAEQRASGLLNAAGAATGEQREKLLRALGAAVENLDDKDLQQRAGWARSIFTKGMPLHERVRFAFKHQERVAFAAKFGVDEIQLFSWKIALSMVGVIDLPEKTTYQELDYLLQVVAEAGCRRQVTNPIMGAILDFRQEATTHLGFGRSAPDGSSAPGGCSAPAQTGVEAFVSAAVQWKLHMTDSFAPGCIPEPELPEYAKCLQKLWHPMSQNVPEWVTTVREKAATYNAAKKEAKKHLESLAAARPAAAERLQLEDSATTHLSHPHSTPAEPTPGSAHPTTP